jgi:hypothetical protein
MKCVVWLVVICLLLRFFHNHVSYILKLSALLLFFKSIELVKGTILGVAVFETYNYLVHHQHWSSSSEVLVEWQGSSSSNDDDDNGEKQQQQQQHSLTSPARSGSSEQAAAAAAAAAAAVAPLWVHIGAGALAGLVQSMILDSWEIALYYIRHYRHHHHHHGSPLSWKTTLPKSLVTTSSNTVFGTINTQLVYRRAVHHSLGYATLFGCYEAIRRSLVQRDIMEDSHAPAADIDCSSSRRGILYGGRLGWTGTLLHELLYTSLEMAPTSSSFASFVTFTFITFIAFAFT